MEIEIKCGKCGYPLLKEGVEKVDIHCWHKAILKCGHPRMEIEIKCGNKVWTPLFESVDTHYVKEGYCSNRMEMWRKCGHPLYKWKNGHPLYKGRVLLKPGRVGAIARSGAHGVQRKCASARDGIEHLYGVSAVESACVGWFCAGDEYLLLGHGHSDTAC